MVVEGLARHQAPQDPTRTNVNAEPQSRHYARSAPTPVAPFLAAKEARNASKCFKPVTKQVTE